MFRRRTGFGSPRGWLSGLVRYAPVRLHRSLTGACHAHARGCARTKWRIRKGSAWLTLIANTVMCEMAVFRIGDYRAGRAKLAPRRYVYYFIYRL
jgi:hypothetical protein